MSNIKYTTDGKKVSIVGKLNSQETIVQEIFIKKDGSEIPSGENFVVRSLHDQPVKSWKESEIERIEKKYNQRKAQFTNELERYQKAFYNERDRLSKKNRISQEIHR